MRSLRLAVLFVLFGVLPVVAYDGVWTKPGRKGSPETKCTTCNDVKGGIATWQYGYPFAAFTGRYIDSTATANQQNVGMRTVRARRIRLSRDGKRLYIGLGEAVGVYKLDDFFTTTLQRSMESPASLATGTALGDRDGSPVEAIAVPYQFFYVECDLSEWTHEGIDIQETLLDFDGDDRKFLYIGSKFGWGMAKENGLERGHMDNLFQLRPDIEADSVFSLKLGAFRYYAVVSQKTPSAGKMLLYDVTDPVVPQQIDFRDKTDDKPNDKYGIVEWAKSDGLQRLALLNTDGHVRIYDYESFIADSAPLADYEPPPGRKFVGVSMDDDGAVWFTTTHDQQVTSNTLYRAMWNPLFNRVDLTTYEDAYGTEFSPNTLNAGGGWVAVGGRSALDALRPGGEMRLFKVTPAGVPVAVPDYGFFRNYYDAAPAGFTSPSVCQPKHIGLQALQLVQQGLKTYLMYSTIGLGDVYELASSDTRIATSVTLTTQTTDAVHLIATVTAAASGAANLSGTVSFSKNGQPLASASVTATTDPLKFVVDLPRNDLNTVATLTATYEGDELYKAAGPTVLPYVPVIPAPTSFNAAAVTSTAVRLTWDNVPGSYDYQVWRKSSTADWTPIATTRVSAYVDETGTSNQVYLYRVRCLDGLVPGLLSAIDIASTHVFTDDPLNAGTPVKAVHVNELRAAINAARALAGLSPFSFNDPTLVRGMRIRAVHETDLRAASEELHTALGLASLLAATPFSRSDMLVLREAIR
jgi:hypothetical protein